MVSGLGFSGGDVGSGSMAGLFWTWFRLRSVWFQVSQIRILLNP